RRCNLSFRVNQVRLEVGGMSALGQNRTFWPFIAMSALPPKADIGTQSRDVRFVPILLQKSRLRARCDFANVLKRSPAIG
ncbi:MAG TPA: hypothetical protein VHT68_11225, partial [Pseudolabrys sp.]|nr:hypothetical protein [Pseudolabrys sp.]